MIIALHGDFLQRRYYVLCRAYDQVIAREASRTPGPGGVARFRRGMRPFPSDNGTRFEDGLVRACAELSGADFIITRDEDALRALKVKALRLRVPLHGCMKTKELMAALLDER